jgi:hypothetical protein
MTHIDNAQDPSTVTHHVLYSFFLRGVSDNIRFSKNFIWSSLCAHLQRALSTRHRNRGVADQADGVPALSCGSMDRLMDRPSPPKLNIVIKPPSAPLLIQWEERRRTGHTRSRYPTHESREDRCNGASSKTRPSISHEPLSVLFSLLCLDLSFLPIQAVRVFLRHVDFAPLPRVRLAADQDGA